MSGETDKDRHILPVTQPLSEEALDAFGTFFSGIVERTFAAGEVMAEVERSFAELPDLEEH